MKIVSNTGPLIGLAKIDRLFILKDIVSEVLIPPAVHRELLGKAGIESEATLADEDIKENWKVYQKAFLEGG
jgi:predicted nucleic acid-binding protein